MLESRELVLILPVYNEEALISEVCLAWLSTIDKLGINFEIHVYDDGSTDKTLALVEELAEREPRLKVHSHSNCGHGPTILRGYREHRQVPWLFQADSDGEIPFDSFPEFWKAREAYDFLIGNRISRPLGFRRRFVTWGARRLVHWCYSSGIEDVNCPFRLMRMEAFSDMVASIPRECQVPNVVISGAACAAQLRIKEMDVTEISRRPDGKSLSGLRLARVTVLGLWETIRTRSYLIGKSDS